MDFCNFNKESIRKIESRLAGNHNARPSKEFQAYSRGGFCSELLIGEAIESNLVGLQNEEILPRRGMKRCTSGGSQIYSKRSSYTEQRSIGGCQEATLDFPPVLYGSLLTRDRQCFTTENDEGLRFSLMCSTNLAAQTGISADLGGMSDQKGFNLHQKSPVLSIGICGNALIMRVGFDARCFHQQGLACGRGQHMVVDACTDVKAYGRPSIDMVRSCSNALTQKTDLLLPGTNTSTKFHADKLRGKTKQKKMGKTSAPTRDLFEMSYFHIFEVLFCHPFISTRAGPLNSQLLSQESLREFVGLTTQAAVGLAGVGVMYFLFVISRMLSVDAVLNKHVVVRLAIGVGFLWLSLAMKRVSDVVICMVGDYSNKRKSKIEKLNHLRKELQRVVLNAIPLLVMCFIGAGLT